MARKTDSKARLAKCIADINSAIETATADHEKQTTFFIGEIDALQRTIDDLTEKRNNAAGKNDTDGFRAAAKDLAAAESTKKQYEESLAAIQTRPVITLEQAAEFLGELEKIQRTISNEATEEVKTHVQQILDIDYEAMKLQNDLIMIAQGLADQAQGIIIQTVDGLLCNDVKVTTIIGATTAYPWRAVAELLRTRRNLLDYNW